MSFFVISPGNVSDFHLRGGVSEVDQEADHGQHEHAEDEDLAGPGLARYELPGPVLGLSVDVTGWESWTLLLGVLDLPPVPVLVLLPLKIHSISVVNFSPLFLGKFGTKGNCLSFKSSANF